MADRPLVIYTDGGARGNPGPGAIGVIIIDGDCQIDSFGRVVGERVTNNQAEYLAVEAALIRARELGGTHLTIKLDSELVASQLRREYKIKDRALGAIFLRVWNLMQGFEKVTFITIPREQNWEADAKVNEALDAAAS
ncbi:MAG: ribonuclease HI family protein [Candidatus Kerfeldbacteria bacterium]|nr:ribonuclease HI family protein [Candidatus Kerfeldbacteria bacterium]